MAKYAAKGAILAVATVAAPTVFTTVPGVKDFGLTLGAADLLDVTTHDSPGGYKEYVAGLLDSDEQTIPVVWNGDNTTHAALAAAMQAGTVLPFKITGKETTPKVYTFSALVRTVGIQWPVAGIQEGSIVLKPTGAITIA